MDAFEDDWEEYENDDIYDNDYILFLNNPIYRYQNNFAVRTVLKTKYNPGGEISYILASNIDSDSVNDVDPLESIIVNKDLIWVKKLHLGKPIDLNIGDYFFHKECNGLKHSVNVVTNIKLGGVIFDIQPLNYNAGKIEDRSLIDINNTILIPDDETKKQIKERLDRIYRK